MKRLILLVAIIAACKKSKNDPAPVISSITPDNGVYSTIVTINGNHFSTSGSVVQFNGKEARVLSATSTVITAEVPFRADTGPVTVTVGGRTATGPVFNYTWIRTASTVAGTTSGLTDGPAAYAQFNNMQQCVVDAQGNIYVVDHGNTRIRKITPAGMVSTFAGSTVGFKDGQGAAAQFKYPQGICIDTQGNLYVTDSENFRIRKITPSGLVSTFAGSGVAGQADGTGINAQLALPRGMCIDTQGNIYFIDLHRIRKITPAGVVTTVAGSTQGYANATGTAAQFSYPLGICADAQGNLYVTDSYNDKIRKITAAGVVTTLAGSTTGYLDGPGSTAQFNLPAGITIDSTGHLFVADQLTHKIRRISPEGVVSTYAGNTSGYLDGALDASRFNEPFGICFDDKGYMYVTDRANYKVRKIIVE
jgi:Gluconolactonase